MLQVPVPELKMRTVSISHLTRQLDTVTGCFLTPVCSKHLSPCTCIFSYQVSTAWLWHPQPQPAHRVPAQPLCFGEEECNAGVMWWHSNATVLPAPAWCQAVMRRRFCASPRKHRVSHQQFLFLSSSAHSLLHQLLQSCADNSTCTYAFTSSSAGKYP